MRPKRIVVSDRAYLNASNPTLIQVVRSATAPDTQIELVGNGTGALTRDCRKAQDAFGTTNNRNDPNGPSTCQCAFRYFKNPSGNQEQEFNTRSPTIFRESNLIRCELPSEIRALDLDTVQVSVLYGASPASGNFSNEVPFNISEGVGYAIDPTASGSYARVHRFQCTAVVTFKPTYFPDVYDRELSEDPRATTPMNFYTTNIGKSVATIAGGFKSSSKPNAPARPPLYGWDCPANPMDPKIQYTSDPDTNLELLKGSYLKPDTTRTPFQPDFKADSAQPLLTKYDMRIFSEAMRDVAADARSPATNTLMIYPPVRGQPNKTDFYLAKSPTGKFRVPVNAIVAPGVNTDPSGENGPLPIGYAALSKSSAEGETCPTFGEMPIPEDYTLAKLWLFRSSLVERTTHSFKDSADHFDRKEFACRGSDSTFSDGKFDYRPSNGSCTQPDCAPEVTQQSSSSPGWHNLSLKDWKLHLNQDRVSNVAPSTQVIDYLYVVTPLEIQRRDMENQSPQSLPYIPYRYVSSLDCRDGSKPDGAGGNGFCIPGRVLSTYELSSEDIGYAFASTDQSIDAQTRQLGTQSKFPLCVLVKKAAQ